MKSRVEKEPRLDLRLAGRRLRRALAACVILISACANDGGSVTTDTTRGAAPPSSEIYVVQRGDTLADIARRLCGDPDAWTYIYEVNAGRPQADGGTLTDPSLIEVGWELIASCGPDDDRSGGQSPTSSVLPHEQEAESSPFDRRDQAIGGLIAAQIAVSFYLPFEPTGTIELASLDSNPSPGDEEVVRCTNLRLFVSWPGWIAEGDSARVVVEGPTGDRVATAEGEVVEVGGDIAYVLDLLPSVAGTHTVEAEFERPVGSVGTTSTSTADAGTGPDLTSPQIPGIAPPESQYVGSAWGLVDIGFRPGVALDSTLVRPGGSVEGVVADLASRDSFFDLSLYIEVDDGDESRITYQYLTTIAVPVGQAGCARFEIQSQPDDQPGAYALFYVDDGGERGHTRFVLGG